MHIHQSVTFEYVRGTWAKRSMLSYGALDLHGAEIEPGCDYVFFFSFKLRAVNSSLTFQASQLIIWRFPLKS